MKIGQGIIKVCELRGISQTELAKKTGYSKTFHSLIESNDREPSMYSLKKIAKILGVAVPAIAWLSLDQEDVEMADPELIKLYKKQIDELMLKIFISSDKNK